MNFWEKTVAWLESVSAGWATRLCTAVIILVIGGLLIRIVMTILNRLLKKSNLDRAAYGLIRTLVRTVLLVLLILTAVASIGVDVTGVVALASVATLAISLSLQNMLANVIGGFTLLYTHPFGAGDFVEIAGQSGSVKEIGIAYTRLITGDNKIVYIPNSAGVGAEIVNYSVTGTRRVDVEITASYDAPIQTVLDCLKKAAQDERILAEPAEPFAALTNYGDSAISYVLRFWVKTGDYWGTKFDVLQRIKETFDEAGVEMTYPHLNVHLDK